MSRAQRLLELIQLLRQHRFPITGHQLAKRLKISLRTLYRDIATLQEQGAHIEGEAGLGYVLKPGFMLPPLMFSQEEIEAIVLGSRWVAERGDPQLASAARAGVYQPASAGVVGVLDPFRLSRLEEAIVRLVAQGLSNKEIGDRLFISERTVKTHMTSILRKTGERDRMKLIATLTRQGR